jgi:4-nitrophenyl phosphatase
MIGDRLDTDIQFGKNGGVSTLLVLTGGASSLLSPQTHLTLHLFFIISGVTSIDQVTPGHATYVEGTVPDYVLQSLGDLQVLMGS